LAASRYPRKLLWRYLNLNNSVGLYIHIPYCARKCTYCDFVSYSDKCETIGSYIRALTREIKSYEKMNINVKTVFFGGGTPSFIDSKHIEHLLDNIRKVFNVSDDAEISLECNPGTADIEKLRAYRDMGINRLSVGVQSFNDNVLSLLGRIHNSLQARSILDMARNAGFENINADLMLGTPGQTVAIAREDIKAAVSSGVSHISAYSLILEDGTPLKNAVNNGTISIPDAEKEYEISSAVSQYLADNGFQRYEVSNYAREGFECRHNLNYWTLGEYFGFGVAAHSFKDGKRESIKKDIHAYCALSDFSEVTEVEEILTEEEYVDEYVMVSLRLCKGLSLSALNSLSKNADTYVKRAEPFVKCGLMEIYELDGERFLRFTPNGFNVSNTVLSEILYL